MTASFETVLISDKEDGMGTNFYFHTKDKECRDHWFDFGEYELTDFPEFGYSIHIAKTSGGWLPLFQSHNYVRSVADMQRLYESGGFKIYDEYGTEYDWPGFKDRVVDFGDGDWGDEKPYSHFEYENGRYAYLYHKDPEGYEFTKEEFS